MRRTYRIVASAWVALFVLTPAAALADATLYATSPPATVCEGETFDVNITLDVDEPANVAEIHMQFDSTSLQVQNIDQFTNSVFPVPAPGTGYDNGAGTLDVFQGQIYPGWQGIGGHLTRITLSTTGSGPAAMSFLPTTILLASDGLATEIPITFVDPVVVVLPSHDPICSPLTISPPSRTVDVGQTVSFSASGGDGTYSWSAPNSTSTNGTGSSFSTSYLTEGDYVVTVTSDVQSAAATVRVNLPATPPPPSFGCSPGSRSILEGESASFSAANGTTPYTWSAPDGSPSSGTGSGFTVSYEHAGTYAVTVTDDGGRTDTCQVQVGVPATPPPTPTPCPEVELCELSEDEVIECEVIESCPGMPDVVYPSYIDANATDVDCPIRTMCPSTFGEDSYEERVEQVLVEVVSEPVARVITETVYRNNRWLELIAGLSAAGTAIATILAAAQVAGLVGGLSQLGSFMLRGIIAPIVPDPSRTRLWGVVFDSVTKRPVPGARVELLSREQRVLETRFTDRDGRYGFVISGKSSPQATREVQVHVSRRGYRFPAPPPTDPDEGLVYQNVYRGGVIVIEEDRLISHDIPIEPEMVPTFEARKALMSAKLSGWFALLADVSFKVGIVIVPLHFILRPSLVSGVILGLYSTMVLARLLGARFRPYGLVLDTAEGTPIPYSFITLNDPYGKRVGQAVSDEHGRFFLLTKRGLYHMDIQTPAQLHPSRKARKVVKSKRGWMSRAIHL